MFSVSVLRPSGLKFDYCDTYGVVSCLGLTTEWIEMVVLII